MINISAENHIATIRLSSPDKRNALTPEMLASLISAIQQIDATDARVILLTGDGPVFCSGFDLSLCEESLDGSIMRALLTGFSDVIQAHRHQPRPVVISAHGAAIAGGCALLGAADFSFTNEDAKLGYPVVRLGISPAVSAPFLRLLVGDGRARERLLDAKLISGKQAAAIGMVTASHSRPPEEIHAIALACAQELADKPPHAISATRRWMNELDALGDSPWHALKVSLSLTGKEEERRLLPLAWKKA